MEITFLNVAITLGSLLLANYGCKLGKAYPLINKAHNLIKHQEEARRDNKLTQKEKAELYDDIESLINEAWGIIRGWLPNRS